jgi:hypothetical protein
MELGLDLNRAYDIHSMLPTVFGILEDSVMRSISRGNPRLVLEELMSQKSRSLKVSGEDKSVDHDHPPYTVG